MLEWIGKRYMRMRAIRHEEQGFTLIELLIVITLLFHKWLCPPGLRPNLLPAPVGLHKDGEPQCLVELMALLWREGVKPFGRDRL